MKEDQELDGLPGHSEAISGVVGGEAAPLHVKWPWRVQVSQHAALSTLFFAEKSSAERARAKIASALKQHHNWAKNARVSTVDVRDALGPHTFSLACVQGLALLDDAAFRPHYLASIKADKAAMADTTEPKDSPGIDHEDSTP